MLGKILVVDDSDLLHRMYDLILSRYQTRGVTVLHAMHGREALSQLTKHPDVDLILLDINMPVMTGLEFLEYCRNENLLGDIPVVVISTKGRESDTRAAMDNGAAAYLTKPFAPVLLHELIESFFAK